MKGDGCTMCNKTPIDNMYADLFNIKEVLQYIIGFKRDYELKLFESENKTWVEIQFFIEFFSDYSSFRINSGYSEELEELNDFEYWNELFEIFQVEYDKDKLIRELIEKDWLKYIK